MADRVEEAGFWLPSEFFDDFIMDKQNSFSESNTEPEPEPEPEKEFCFPTEFPYPETESDEEDLFTLFTHQTPSQILPPQHLEKGLLMSTSPQSTLTDYGSWSAQSAGGSSNGSPNGPSQVPSPPTTPLGLRNDVSWDLIYQAAGQVAKLKLNNNDGPIEQKGLLGQPRSLHQRYPVALRPSVSVPTNTQGHGMSFGQPDMYQNRRMSQIAWSIQQNSTRVLRPPTRPGLLDGPGGGAMVLKRECSGTGVFLPRRYGNNNNNNKKNNSIDCNVYSSVTRRKPVHANPLLPNRATVDYMNHFAQSPPLIKSQSRFYGAFTNYDLLVARRNAELLMSQRSVYLLMAQRNLLMLQRSRSLLSDGSAMISQAKTRSFLSNELH